MIEDEVIREVWQVRDEIAARFNYDVRAIGAYYLKLQEESGMPTVTLSPRKPVDTRLGVSAHAQNGNGAKPQPQSGNAQVLVSMTEDFEEYTQ